MKTDLEESIILNDKLNKALVESQNDLASKLQNIKAKRDRILEERDREHEDLPKELSALYMTQLLSMILMETASNLIQSYLAIEQLSIESN